MDNNKQSDEIKQNLTEKVFENITRADSGLNRLIISLMFILLSGFTIYLGYKLIDSGATGEFHLFTEYKGLKFVLWSLSPGIGFCFIGIALLIWALPKTLKAFFDWKMR